MKWKKLGKIFDPTSHPDFVDFKGYSQSPQALVLADRIRIYFSIRTVDSNSKFLSHISFVDFDLELKNIIETSKKPVIKLGELGSFDEHGIFPFNPVKTNDKILAFTCGWSRRLSVSIETSIGLAVSTDQGLSFDKFGTGPVLSSSLHEPFLVGDAFVKEFDSKFHMWYIFGTKWDQFPGEKGVDRVYKIGHAVSDEGINWNREGRAIISDKIDEHECQALPTVIEFDGKYHMIFCYRQATGFREIKGRGYRLGYAFSENLIDWIRQDEKIGIDVSKEGWDSDMMCYPNLFKCNDRVYLLYNGNEFGKYGFGLAVLEN